MTYIPQTWVDVPNPASPPGGAQPMSAARFNYMEAGIVAASSPGGAASTETSDFTLSLAEVGGVVEVNSATPVTASIAPTSAIAYPAGSTVEIYQVGAGAVTVTGGLGVTVPAVATANPGDSVFLRKRPGTNIWTAVGGQVTYHKQPADFGLLGSSFTPEMIASQVAPTTGVIYASRIKVPVTRTFSSVVLYTGTAGAGPLTANQCFVGIADANSNVLGQSAAGVVEANILPVGEHVNALTATSAGSLTVTGGPNVEIMAFFLLVGSGMPSLSRLGTSANPAFLARSKRTFGQSNGPFTSVPNPISSWATTPSQAFWMGVA